MLLGLPWLQRALADLRRRVSPAAFVPAVAGALLVCSVDNLVFIGVHARGQLRGEEGFFLTQGEREFLRKIEQAGLEGVAAFRDPRLSYLAATYTGLTPYFGHLFNTVDYKKRVEQVERLYSGVPPSAIAWLDEIRYVAVSEQRTRLLSLELRSAWRPVVRGEGLTLYAVDARATSSDPREPGLLESE